MLWLLVSPKVGGKIIQGYWRVKAPSSVDKSSMEVFTKKNMPPKKNQQAQVLGEGFGAGFEYKL